MSRLRILNAEPDNYSREASEILASLGKVTNTSLTRGEILSRIPEFDILITRLAHQIDREILDRAASLKVIVTATTGLDHIDVAYAHSKSIAVLSLRGETNFLRSIPATAEYTWALLLALIRHIPQAYQSVLDGEWDRDRFKGHDLAGKTLGILGLGRIGEKVARYGQAFGMRVIAYDSYRRDWLPGVERAGEMETLLSQSQVLSIHVPLSTETRQLLGAAQLALLPLDAILVNTSRGQVINEVALINALVSGRLAGAALDVICMEGRGELANSLIIEYTSLHTNLLITPHIGGATFESMAATEVFMAKKLKKHLEDFHA